jgi:predicted O-methyltransferase YrrM
VEKPAPPIFGPLVSRVRALRLKREANKCRSVEDYVDLAFNFPVGSPRIIPLQVKEEIVQTLRLLTESRPKIVCEIGTANGGTLFLFSRVSSPNATIISIDLPGVRFDGGNPE